MKIGAARPASLVTKATREILPNWERSNPQRGERTACISGSWPELVNQITTLDRGR